MVLKFVHWFFCRTTPYKLLWIRQFLIFSANFWYTISAIPKLYCEELRMQIKTLWEEGYTPLQISFTPLKQHQAATMFLNGFFGNRMTGTSFLFSVQYFYVFRVDSIQVSWQKNSDRTYWPFELDVKYPFLSIISSNWTLSWIFF